MQITGAKIITFLRRRQAKSCEGQMYIFILNRAEFETLPSNTRYVTVSPNYALQGKFHLCISLLGIAWPRTQFPHSCVYERFIYCQYRSTYFPAAE